MWPWGHLGVAYLLYAAIVRRRTAAAPAGAAALAVALGSQTPDLIDKPLAWTFGVLPGGRTLGHSALFAAVSLPALYALARRRGRGELAIAFGIGYLSHLLADVPPSALRGDLEEVTFLAWPLFPAPREEPVEGILHAILTYYELGAYEWFQFAVFAAGAYVWYRDGAPGLDVALAPLRRTLSESASE